MKIIRDEKTQNVIEVIFTDKELDTKESLMSSIAQMEQARYHVAEVNIEKTAETNIRDSENRKEAQLDFNKCQLESNMNYNKYQAECAKDFNRRQQQMQYLTQFPGTVQLPPWLLD